MAAEAGTVLLQPNEEQEQIDAGLPELTEQQKLEIQQRVGSLSLEEEAEENAEEPDAPADALTAVAQSIAESSIFENVILTVILSNSAFMACA